LQAFYAARALVDESFTAYYEIDAIRHFLALGFMTTMIIGMAFLVLPPLAMRRVAAKPVRLAVPVLLTFLHGATAARGAGSLLVSEAQVDNGFWVMSVGGMAAIGAMALFAVHLLRRPQGPEISLSQVESRQ